MNEVTSKLVDALKRRDCNLPTFVSLLSKQLQLKNNDVKQMLYKFKLHRLEPNEDESIGYTIQLTNEQIIKNYLLNNKIYDSPYHVKPPRLIKWEKAVLINWLRKREIQIPKTWEEWIKKYYPVLQKHSATTKLGDTGNRQPSAAKSDKENDAKSDRSKSKQDMYDKWCMKRLELLGSGAQKYFKPMKVPNESEIARTISKEYDVTPAHVMKMIREHCK